MGLAAVGAAEHLAGELIFFAIPAEEFIDVEERLHRKERGEIEFLLGKPELVAKGHFDDIDMAMMIHVGSHDQMTKRSYIADSSNGALVKQIRFFGRASHAGGAPQLGINALSAAMLALNAIHAQRESFWEKDTIRIHPIITKGGDAVSVVPAEVHMETFVRGGSREAILDANMKVDRCLKAGAMSMGAEVEINTIPGYLPQRNSPAMGALFGGNVETMFGPGSFDIGGHRTGSTDMGDIAHMKPVIHPYVASARGKTHGADFRINEPEHAYLTPAKLLAMTSIANSASSAPSAGSQRCRAKPCADTGQQTTCYRVIWRTTEETCICREGPRYSGQPTYRRVIHPAIRRPFGMPSANVGTGVSAITAGSRTTASTSYVSSRAANLRLGTPTRNRTSSFTSSRVNSSSSPIRDAKPSGQAPASHSRQAPAMVITS